MAIGEHSNTRKSNDEIKQEIIERIAELASNLSKMADIAQKILWAAQSCGKAWEVGSKGSNALAASKSYIEFCLQNPGDHSSHEWHRHIGRLGGNYNQVYKKQKESIVVLAKILPANDLFRQDFERQWPVILNKEKILLSTARRKKVAHSQESFKHTGLLGQLYRNLENSLRKTHGL